MLNPFLKLQFSSWIWYQGESSVGPDKPFQGAAYYACQLPAMIADWRNKLQQPDLPVIVVELAAYVAAAAGAAGAAGAAADANANANALAGTATRRIPPPS